ncbi:hypothetical protein BTM25_36940 [Actinomadura rubteroloni]|uniref:Uncharacterized protein n=1 Tax=Actinomadura rubteroloni TaxID=1926885 RepID=A0A2P4UJ14_9ACTN|nr:hypothetical protein [Actinomadura rubteroloni]POM25052.1 hypothetical protein BTM25_36940 [Actinomadura rubteroloni]
MRAVLGGWTAAVLVFALGFGALLVFGPDDSGDDLDQIMRVHLPWIVANFLAAWAAGAYLRRSAGVVARVGLVLVVPGAATACGVAAGVPRAFSAFGVVLHVIEALFGVAVGLAMARGLARDAPEDRPPAALEKGWEGFYGQAVPPERAPWLQPPGATDPLAVPPRDERVWPPPRPPSTPFAPPGEPPRGDEPGPPPAFGAGT